MKRPALPIYLILLWCILEVQLSFAQGNLKTFEPYSTTRTSVHENTLDEIFELSKEQTISGVSKIKLDDRILYIVGESHSESDKLNSYFKNILNYKNVLLLEEGQSHSCTCDKCHPNIGLEDIDLYAACLNIINRNIAYKKNTQDKELIPFPSRSYFEQHEHLQSYLVDYDLFLEKPSHLLLEIISEPRNQIFVHNLEKTLNNKTENNIVVRVGELHRSFITLYFLKKYDNALLTLSDSTELNKALYESAQNHVAIYTLSTDEQAKSIAQKNAIYYLRLIHRNKQCDDIATKQLSLEKTLPPKPLETQALNSLGPQASKKL